MNNNTKFYTVSETANKMKTANLLKKKESVENIAMPEVNEHDPMPKKAFCSKKRFTNAVRQVQDQLTVRQRYEIFMGETSFTAIAKIHKATSIVKRIAWIFVLFAMLSWLTIQCYWLLEKYFNYPVEVKIEKKASPILDFPSVTFCNRNPLKSSNLRIPDNPFSETNSYFSLSSDTKLFDKASEMFREKEDSSSSEETNAVLGNSSSVFDLTNSTVPQNVTSIDWTERMAQGNFNQWDALSDSVTAEGYYDSMDQECAAGIAYSTVAATADEDEMQQYGHSKNDFIMSCKYGGYKCSPANFTYMLNLKYGNCFTFNSYKDPNPPVKTNFAGPLMGLVVELYIEQNEYINALAPDAGVRMIIHDRGTYPFPEDNGVSVPPGSLTSVGIKKIRHIRLPPPHANCSDTPKREDAYVKKFGVNYSKETCLKSCWQEKLTRQCGCAVPIYLVQNNSNVCDMTNSTKEACVLATIDTFSSCDTDCPELCSENVFEMSMSSAKWPSENYEYYLDSKLAMSSYRFMGGGSKPSSEDNLAKIEVFFMELAYDHVEQQKAYEVQNLISDIGGQLGLWLGLSAITIGEFIEFFAAIFKAMTAKAVKKKQQTAVQAIQ